MTWKELGWKIMTFWRSVFSAPQVSKVETLFETMLVAAERVRTVDRHGRC